MLLDLLIISFILLFLLVYSLFFAFMDVYIDLELSENYYFLLAIFYIYFLINLFMFALDINIFIIMYFIICVLAIIIVKELKAYKYLIFTIVIVVLNFVIYYNILRLL